MPDTTPAPPNGVPVHTFGQVQVTTPAAPSFAPAPPPLPPAAQGKTRPAPLFPGGYNPPPGARLRMSKRATGWEGNGSAPGSLINVSGAGIFAEDVARTGSMEQYIGQFFVPRYGPFPGHPDTVYVVDVLDVRGNVVTQYEFPFGAPAGVQGQPPPQAFAAPPQPFQQPAFAPAYPPPAPAGPTAMPGESAFLAYLMKENEKRERQFEEMKAAHAAANNGRLDPMTLLLLERQKPELVDVDAKMREYRAQYAPFPEPNEVVFPPQRGPTRNLGGDDLSGVFSAPPPPVPAAPLPNPMEPVAQALGKVTELLGTVAAAAQTRPAPVAAERPASDPMLMHLLTAQADTNKVLMTAMLTPKPQNDDALIRYMERQDAKFEVMMKEVKEALKPPEKSKGMAEMLGDFREMSKTMKEISGGGDERTFADNIVDAIGAIADNADKLGTLVQSFGGRAPTLPAPAGGTPGQKQLTAGKQAAPAANQPPPVLSDAGKAAIIAIRDAPEGVEGQQAVADGVFGLLTAMSTDKHPYWQKMVQLLRDGFFAADSKPELRALVTTLFIRVGAKPLAANERVVEKVTTVLHTNYTFLFKALGGKTEKVLADGAPPPVAEVKKVVAEPQVADLDLGDVAPAPPKSPPPAAVASVPAPPASPPIIEGETVTDDDEGDEGDDDDTDGDDDAPSEA